MENSLELAKDILARALDIESEGIAADDDMNSLEKWDSLAHMRLILSLEEAYNIEVDADHIVDLVSVQAIGQYLGEITN